MGATCTTEPQSPGYIKEVHSVGLIAGHFGDIQKGISQRVTQLRIAAKCVTYYAGQSLSVVVLIINKLFAE